MEHLTPPVRNKGWSDSVGEALKNGEISALAYLAASVLAVGLPGANTLSIGVACDASVQAGWHRRWRRPRTRERDYLLASSSSTVNLAMSPSSTSSLQML
jgi:hypothetical protein